MTTSKKPRKQGNLTKGFGQITMNHQRQLRAARKRIEGRDLAAEGWSKAAQALHQATEAIGQETRRG